ncbi:hypothetical protein LXH13_17995 [Streptomyces spinosirectus]|jgi:hypothetical protein|uniref:hypothetical protein n=1 Tax=Streptomyces TaxID=1883 RepID=UPI000D49C0BB|nr:MULTISPECIES: hypothetical protein [Streptomyces]MBY8340219.1 hypothetical protein [Streptomyces plumbidurans]PTM88966.1 hypothetical protein C7821_113124 [Streptomyces sp. VMFN-G11Ma]UIR18823.1 hypothetical protein LXH13_17995 [Streptomyces spinosirectus]
METDIESRFRRVGLEVIGRFTESGRPSVTEAFHKVVHIDAEPVERIQRRAVDAAQRVDEAWKNHASNGGVLSDDGSFLAAGSMAYGWVHVRLTDSVDIAALGGPQKELIFIARSLSGHRVCAASTEGDEYWILEAEFPESS